MMNWKQLLSPHRLGSHDKGIITLDRSPFQRDFDRVVFSGAFRRLQNKTQVFPLVQADYVRTRLTHSLESSSIARSLGTAVGVVLKENYDLGDIHVSDVGSIVATAALCHDIGNPPLGHPGEEAIRYWFTTSQVAKEMKKEFTPSECADIECYEGNAQGFRILSTLEMPDQIGGMQLSCATLGAFAKYPCSSLNPTPPKGVAGKKFSFFQSEKELFREVAQNCGLISYGVDSYCRHPLAFLVEAADDIAYLIVDFEDAARLGMVEQRELEERFIELLREEGKNNKLDEISNCVRRAEYLRAKVIGVLVKEVAKVFLARIEDIMSGSLEYPLTELLSCSDKLKALRKRSVELIYHHRKVTEIVGAGFEMVSGMLDIFVPCINELALEHSGKKIASYRSQRLGALLTGVHAKLDDPAWCDSGYQRMLSVLDFISGMTDSYAVSIYRKLKGISL